MDCSDPVKAPTYTVRPPLPMAIWVGFISVGTERTISESYKVTAKKKVIYIIHQSKLKQPCVRVFINYCAKG